ncbi:transcriptional regulator, MarR family [Sphingomonas guangdongensis]|uniref:Transcriptional regulator, MarR family n=1 Tax=Sphingomonas guangdongensis TaxID=1141890 RepID=A0A285Q9N3_9SPHN|nr:MarR family transcriptional regulator [Sphingomonas guangdongensis]SOB78583.1 transcriptional regulator, MarR family [Sphingomonas guangdongensis]
MERITAKEVRPELEFVRECVLLGRRWRSMADERLKAKGLTLARGTVLYWLAEANGPITQSRLAELIGIEGPTLVRLLHALEAQGLVERVPFEGDRRAKGLRLTEAAAPFLDMIDSVTDAMCDEYLGRLEKRRLSSATRLVREAHDGLR